MSDLLPGTLLNQRYRLDSEIGRGGMGIVYRAHDTLLERDVAVKVLNDPSLGTEGRGYLLREAQAAARLNHPNIVAMYDAGEENGIPYLVMELVPGESLYEHKPTSLAEILAIARQICDALEHAHQNGIIHRDLKPENIILSDAGTAAPEGERATGVYIKLMDFGLARSIASRLTNSGAITGTVFYMAPELALGQDYDGRADLYALGVVLYELLTGRLPFSADDPLAVISQHLYAPVVPPQTYNRDLPAPFNALIVQMLSKQAADRPATALEINEKLLQIEQAGSLSPVDMPAASPLEQIVRGRLVGRSAEISQLRQHWEQAMQEGGHLVLISGEPGVGKTRLADELIAYVRLQGGAVLQGGCYEYEAATPYLPLIEALRDWVNAQSDAVLRATLGTTAAELARLAPEIDARLGPLPASPPLPPEQERLRLFDSLARFLQVLAAEKGLFLFLDDLHWSEHATLALLHYLLRRLRGEKLLVLGAYREVELDRSHPLAALLVEWNRERLVTRLQIGRLTSADCARLLTSMFGLDEVSDEFVQAIYRETEGNPFFIEEVVKALVEQGQIYRENDSWGRAEVAELAIPQSIKEAIGRRLNKLETGQVEALQYAGVLGKTFTFAEFLTGFDSQTNGGATPEDRLLDILDRALDAQLIRTTKDEGFAFTHDKIREVLYEELNPVRRRRMHQRAGEGLERLYTGRLLDAHVQDIAYHFLQSNDLHRALEYSLLAAEKAGRLFAHAEALRYYQHAAECAAALENPAQLAEIYEQLGEAYAAQGLAYPSVEHYLKTLELVSDAKQIASLKMRIGAQYIGVGDERGLVYLNDALAELDPAAQSTELASVQANLGRYHHYHARHAQAIESLERSRKLAEPVDDPGTLYLIYAYLAGAYQHLTNFPESTRWAEECIALGKRKNYPLATAIGYEFLSENTTIQGNWPEGLKNADLDRDIGKRIGAQSRIAWAGFPAAICLRELGRLDEALQSAQQAFTMAEQIGENRLRIWVSSMLAFIHGDLGEIAVAVDFADEAIAQADEIGQVALQCWSRYARINLYLLQGDWQPASELCIQSRSLFEAGDNQLSRIYIGLVAPEVYIGAGRLQEAEAWLAEHLTLTRAAQTAHYEGVGLRMQGQLFAAQKMWAEAQEAFGQAVTRFENLGSQLELGRTLYRTGQMQLERGQPVEAHASWGHALEIFASSNARPWSERAREALDGLAPAS